MDKQEIIKRCILRSKYIMFAKTSRITIRHNIFFLNRIPIKFQSQDKLNELDIELLNVINEFERYIARQLRSLFEEKGIRTTDKFWFSNINFKDGYVLLYKSIHHEIASHVLFLSPTIGFDGNIIKRGEILPFQEVTPILVDVKPIAEYEEEVATKFMYKRLNQTKNG